MKRLEDSENPKMIQPEVFVAKESKPVKQEDKLIHIRSSISEAQSFIVKEKANVASGIEKYGKLRQELGLKESKEIPHGLAADQEGVAGLQEQVAELQQQEADLQAASNLERNPKNQRDSETLSWLPNPSVKEVGTDGVPGHTFWKFSPDQREEIGRDLISSYEGKRFNIGDQVIAKGGKAEVVGFVPGFIVSEVDYSDNVYGTTWRERVVPARLDLRSKEDGGLFSATAGSDEVRHI